MQASYLVDGTSLSRTATVYNQQKVSQQSLYYLNLSIIPISRTERSSWVLAETEKKMDEEANVVWSTTQFAPTIIPLDYTRRPTKPVATLQCTNPDQDLVCATEENLRKLDSNFTHAPSYVEHGGVLSGRGFIAAVTISSIVVAVAIFYAVNTSLMRKQQQRLKASFSATVSRHIYGGLTSTSSLSLKKVSKLYHEVDTDGNGNIFKSGD